MCIFYLLHEITEFKDDVPNGKRNARIFMLGIIIYCLVYILLVNLWDKNYFNKNTTDAIFWAGLVLFMADVSIMGYIYKSYYGRSLLNEYGDDEEWLYNDEKHKYYSISKIKVFKDELEKKDKNESMNIKILPVKHNLISVINEENKSDLNNTKSSKKSKKSTRV